MNPNELQKNASAIAATPGIEPETLLTRLEQLVDEALSDAPDSRRERARFPICYTFELTPIDTNGQLLHEESKTIYGKDLSATGIGFAHSNKLPYRRVLISFSDPNIGTFAVEAELRWTRNAPLGEYESGCRLLQKAPEHALRCMGT